MNDRYAGDIGRHRLNVVQGEDRPGVRIYKHGTLDLVVRSGTRANKRLEVLHGWYRNTLRKRIPPLIEKWEPILGSGIEDWGIKRMKTRWGTCSQDARRVWVNLELAKKPPECLEYILVHEMVHLLEPHHGERFADIMTRVLPQWRMHRAILNQAPLSHEKWRY